MKKLLFSTLAFIAMCFGIVACHDMDDYQPQDDSSQAKARMKTITVEEAKKQALMFVDNLGIQTRSLLNKEVGDVYVWNREDIFPSSRNTTSMDNLPDTLMYIVNFKNNQGYVLVSANRNTESILAYVEEGSLRPNQQIDNRGFRIFLNGIGRYLLTSGDHGPLFPPIDTTGIGNLFTIDSLDMEIAVDFMKEPLLTTKWHEDAPFNDECPLSYNSRSKAGDGAVALAQVAGYYRSPDGLEGHTFYWDEILDGEEPTSSIGMSSVAHLVHDLGEYSLADYNRTHTDIDFSDMQYALDVMDYNYDETSYSFNLCRSEFNANRPVIVEGWDNTHTTSHKWVMDGAVAWVIRRTIYYSDGSIQMTRIPQKLVHCNWGLGGNYNGYFLTGAFDINHKTYEDDVNDPIIQDLYDDTSNFSSFINMYYHLYPY